MPHASPRGQRQVVVVDASWEVVGAIATHGLILQTGEEMQTVRLTATTDPHEAGPAEIVFVFVKAQHTAAAARLQGRSWRARPPSSACRMAGATRRTLAVFPPEGLVMGVTYHSATVLAPGHVAHTGKGATFVGPYVHGAPLDRAESVRQVLAQGGIEATVTPRVKMEIWKKLIYAATLPTAALTRPARRRPRRARCTARPRRCARRRGGRRRPCPGDHVDSRERIERIHTVLSGAGKGKASMLQDVEAYRKTEIEVINGAIVRAAERSGVDVPLNRAMLALIGGLERGWQQ